MCMTLLCIKTLNVFNVRERKSARYKENTIQMTGRSNYEVGSYEQWVERMDFTRRPHFSFKTMMRWQRIEHVIKDGKGGVGAFEERT